MRIVVRTDGQPDANADFYVVPGLCLEHVQSMPWRGIRASVLEHSVYLYQDAHNLHMVLRPGLRNCDRRLQWTTLHYTPRPNLAEHKTIYKTISTQDAVVTATLAFRSRCLSLRIQATPITVPLRIMQRDPKAGTRCLVVPRTRPQQD